MSISDPKGILNRKGFDIWDEEQRPIVFAYPDAGMQGDQQKAATYLTVGETYDFDWAIVSGWSTEVRLIQFPGIGFNSVHFCEMEDYEDD